MPYFLQALMRAFVTCESFKHDPCSLLIDQKPSEIWKQHSEILDVIILGDGAIAEKIARQHITRAAAFVKERLAN